MPKRPNVLFLICDDLNDAIEGWGGHPQTRTPHLARLMQRGMSFFNGHCNASICAPSRASLWSGLYPHTTGNYAFRHWKHNAILNDTVMMQQHFRDNGYKVFATGKLHHNGQEDKSVYDDFGYDANFGPFPFDGINNETMRYPHPNLSELFDSDDEMPIAWEQTFGPLSCIPTWPEEMETGAGAGWGLSGKPFRYVNDQDRDRMPDELSVDWAIDTLQAMAGDTPFFLGVGFNRPHTPLYVPDEYFDRFPLDEIELPPYLDDDLNDAPEIVKSLYDYGQRRFNFHCDKNIDHWKAWVQAYLACVSFVDDQVGRLLDALDQSPAKDNTIIVFTSDNGYHMGEKNVLFKNTLWEEATRVPYFLAVPGVTPANSACHKAVSLIDLYPTLADLCGLPSEPNANGNGYPLDGHSLRPLLSDPEAGWDGPEAALTAVPTNKTTLAEYGPHIGPAHFSQRGDRWRYSLFGNGEEELFDHESDPLEYQNRASNDGYEGIHGQRRSELLDAVPEWLDKEEKPDWETMDWHPL